MSGLVLDLFAGPGGWDQGALPLGLRPIGVEWDAAACLTGNAAGHHRVRADVSKLPTEPMAGKVVGLIASPPCQTFSMAGNGKGRDALPELQNAVEAVWKGASPASVCPADLDVRSVLVLEPVRYARDLRPEWIACEQVPAVLPIWQAFAVILRMNGYSAWTGVLNAADYGVPQTRQRAILVASRVRKIAPPEPTHCQGGEPAGLFGDGRAPWVSMAKALGWETPGERGYRLARGAGMLERHGERRDTPDVEPAPVVTSKARTATWEYVNGTQENAARRPVTEPAPTVMFGHRSNDVRWVAYRSNRESGKGSNVPRPADEPAPTADCQGQATSVPEPDPEGQREEAIRALKPGQKRWLTDPATTIVSGHNRSTTELPNGGDASSVRVTVEEAAVLQSFPADYPWQGSRTKQFEQVGNAVPPQLAMHVLATVTGLTLPAAQGEVAA